MADLVGTGIELVSVPRFHRVIERRGERLLERLFTEAERAYAARKRNGAQNLAVRFAAKAAGRRALAGVVPGPIPLREIEVVRRRSGEPTLALCGGAAARAPEGLHVAVSLTHDETFGLASVWVERLAPLQ